MESWPDGRGVLGKYSTAWPTPTRTCCASTVERVSNLKYATATTRRDVYFPFSYRAQSLCALLAFAIAGKRRRAGRAHHYHAGSPRRLGLTLVCAVGLDATG